MGQDNKAGKYSSDGHPFIQDLDSDAEASVDSILVTRGSFSKRYENLAGRSVESVRQSLQAFANIPKTAKIRVNSEPALPSYILKGGDRLEFYLKASDKG